MGLDMSLDSIKKTGDTFENTVRDAFSYREGKVEAEELVYWRKANAIHSWFVRNVQNNEDLCEEHQVSKEKIEQLINDCKEVLADNDKSESILPAQSGFFFGSTEYDVYYFEDLWYTVENLQRVLQTHNFETHYLVYSSSW